MSDLDLILAAIPSVDEIEQMLLSGLCRHLIDIGDCGACLSDRLERRFRERLAGSQPGPVGEGA